MKCNTCNKEFNPAILDEVIFHETHTPAVACGLIGEPANDLMANLPPSPTGQYKSVNGKPVPATREDMGRAFEFALTQSTAAQSSEIERLKRELSLSDVTNAHYANEYRELCVAAGIDLDATDHLDRVKHITALLGKVREVEQCLNAIDGPQIERALNIINKSLTSSPQNGEKGKQ